MNESFRLKFVKAMSEEISRMALSYELAVMVSMRDGLYLKLNPFEAVDFIDWCRAKGWVQTREAR